ncbi:MAG: helix-turn-helix domain-containing protein [Acidobacteriota bacterium]
MKSLSIGDLAKATGVKVVTIRYYEQAGLIPPPLRTEGNYRAYTADDVRRLQFVRRLRALGFTLDQIRDLLLLSSEKNQACNAVDRMTKRHLKEVQQKLHDLQLLASELERLSQCCQGKGRIAECRIIEALAP